MEINFGDLFIHVPTHSLHQCVGSDDELVWYIPKGESESKWFDVGDCSKDPSDLFNNHLPNSDQNVQVSDTTEAI